MYDNKRYLIIIKKKNYIILFAPLLFFLHLYTSSIFFSSRKKKNNDLDELKGRFFLAVSNWFERRRGERTAGRRTGLIAQTVSKVFMVPLDFHGFYSHSWKNPRERGVNNHPREKLLFKPRLETDLAQLRLIHSPRAAKKRLKNKKKSDSIFFYEYYTFNIDIYTYKHNYIQNILFLPITN